MRQYKFRAWIKSGFDDDIVPFMAKVDALKWDFGRLILTAKDNDWDQDDFELMAWTGLTDKNGKLIYEGDLVLFDGWQGKGFEIKWDDVNCGFEVVAIDDASICNTLHMDDKYEVIGNIYESPELLKT